MAGVVGGKGGKKQIFNFTPGMQRALQIHQMELQEIKSHFTVMKQQSKLKISEFFVEAQEQEDMTHKTRYGRNHNKQGNRVMNMSISREAFVAAIRSLKIKSMVNWEADAGAIFDTITSDGQQFGRRDKFSEEIDARNLEDFFELLETKEVSGPQAKLME